MCGIGGIYDPRLSHEDLTRRLRAMAQAMRHRGPDDEGLHLDTPLGVGLACRRLAIMDPAGGRQPLANEDGSIHAVCNGEIYNHKILRAELEGHGHVFSTRSDAEVIVHAYEEFGDAFLERIDGMFGLALLDARRRVVLLARDRMGMKPLYLSLVGGALVFASEIRAILATGMISARPDTDSLALSLVAGYLPAPRTCFAGIEKLDAGEVLVIKNGGLKRRIYWQARFSSTEPISDADWVKGLDDRLDAAVHSHLNADVPVGVFVSGGLDSSLIADYARRASNRRLRSYSIVFPEDPAADESAYSRAMAKALGSDHSEIELRAGDVAGLLAKVVEGLEEPLVTAPALASYRLASLAARDVKVVLSGEGADELFAGYPWLLDERAYRLRGLFPRRAAQRLAERAARERVRRWLRILGANDEESADREALRFFTPQERRSIFPGLPAAIDESELAAPAQTVRSTTDRLQRRLAFELTRRLGQGILAVTDKMTMANSLELRMPFLDRAVVDYALRMPSRLKVRRGREKYVVSQLADRLPPEIARRRKFGLHYPVARWLAGPLRSYVRDFILDPRQDGLLDRDFLARRIDRWLDDPHAGPQKLWAILFVQTWHDRFFDSAASGSQR